MVKDGMPLDLSEKRRRFPLDESISEHRELISRLGRQARVFERGEILEYEGEEEAGAYWLLDGWTALSKQMEDGRRHILDVSLPLDCIHVEQHDQGSLFEIRALTSCVVAWMNRTQFEQECGADELFAMANGRLNKAREVRKAERELRLAQGNAREKLAYVLLEFYVRASLNNGHTKNVLTLPLTQTDLGDMTGLTSVHVSRVLTEMKADGLISSFDHSVVIDSAGKLASICQLDLDAFSERLAPISDTLEC